MSFINPILFIIDFLPALESNSSKHKTNKLSIEKILNKYIKNKDIDIDNNKDKYVVFNPVFEIIK